MLTISKPLSAGQAQTYHAKEFTAKEQNYGRKRVKSGANGRASWRRDSVLPVPFPRPILRDSAKASTREQEINSFDNMLPMNIKVQTARR